MQAIYDLKRRMERYQDSLRQFDNADFEKKHPRNADGQFAEQPDENPANHRGKTSVEHLFEVAKSRKGLNKSYAILGDVSSNYTKQVKQAIGIDVSDFEHGIDEVGMAHVNDRHSDEKTEALQAQIPVTLEDIKKIPEILENPDKVEAIPSTWKNTPRVKVTKMIGNRVIVVQEAWTGRKRMNVVSMRIEKAHKKAT